MIANNLLSGDTAENYFTNILPNIKYSNRKWLDEILEHKKEAEWILYEDEYIILIPDHAFIKTQKIEDLHYLIFFKDRSLMSIRDINGNNFNFIKETMDKCSMIVKEKYNYNIDPICYFHYFPSVWQLHIHIRFDYIKNRRDILFNKVYDNIKIDSDYYSKATICYDRDSL